MKQNSLQKKRAGAFVATKTQHLQESAEDYTELIEDLITQKGEARVCDIANNMSVSHVTALKVIRRLKKEGYVETAPHQPIMLTEKGKQLAKSSKERHNFLLEFLIRLGVPEEIAAVDVEGMEHHVSSQTLSALKTLMQDL